MEELPVVLEDIQLHRATIMPKEGTLNFFEVGSCFCPVSIPKILINFSLSCFKLSKLSTLDFSQSKSSVLHSARSDNKMESAYF